MTIKNFLCKVGFHNDVEIIRSMDIHGFGISGAVIQCKWCNRYDKWGTAYYPDYIEKLRKTESS